MKTGSTCTAAAVLSMAVASACSADVWPHADGMMKHIMVALENQTIMVHVEGDPLESLEMLRYPGESYTPPADVLNEKFYNSRYGWMADGFISLPDGAGVFVSVLSSDAGLEVYEGGMRSMKHMHTYAPILGTAGSDPSWLWGGTMVHNWYAASKPGSYSATYSVYVGDVATGAPLDGYTPGQATVFFHAVPAPGSLGALALGAVVAGRRRREVR
ncbi:MAG: PEP-CTERM sorting domain-containing protein [Phycisphaeraceae bacterium]|nr:PEP-CTERM sorting domain-containing protein [Phycisphaeraceae bacterium]